MYIASLKNNSSLIMDEFYKYNNSLSGRKNK